MRRAYYRALLKVIHPGWGGEIRPATVGMVKACKQLKSGIIPSTSERLLLQGENWFAK